jgi:hypothetical protein
VIVYCWIGGGQVDPTGSSQPGTNVQLPTEMVGGTLALGGDGAALHRPPEHISPGPQQNLPQQNWPSASQPSPLEHGGAKLN